MPIGPRTRVLAGLLPTSGIKHAGAPALRGPGARGPTTAAFALGSAPVTTATRLNRTRDHHTPAAGSWQLVFRQVSASSVRPWKSLLSQRQIYLPCTSGFLRSPLPSKEGIIQTPLYHGIISRQDSSTRHCVTRIQW